MWENLKAKLPLKAKYTEDNDSFEVSIVDMEITQTRVTFKLKTQTREFEVNSARDYVGVRPHTEGLLIDASNIWTLLLRT